jgi:hypothetical protein
LIHASSTWNFDLVLDNLIGEKRGEQRFTHCLLAEFNFILKKVRRDRTLREANKDIDRLSAV